VSPYLKKGQDCYKKGAELRQKLAVSFCSFADQRRNRALIAVRHICDFEKRGGK
jgi:hypothetical protein